ncbi:SDR family oxidoreductase [Streptomyces silvisoli]|uniref:SDR family oxidoreductase n=1 Tax=Streptomyces silvisoli TaxID=3034235 RepID=A0ABT5ZRM1_9ACTN|nr:SDR family oxidoreductase [Streptomyces silvisoli]MDF3292255.1 SDR family oxidoreductase [Streptomyces silvisoli]
MTRGLALITGAGGGIGSAIAVALAEAGMSVALLGRRPEPLARTARACARFGVPVVELRADVTDPAQVRAAVDTAGPVDLLVNNAGAVDRHEVPLWEADGDQWWRTYETNVRGTVNLCRAVLPGMIARASGRVVNINSILALRHEPHYSAYSASKMALLGLSGMLAEPLRRHGVLVFDISPGMVRTDMTLGMALCAGRTDWTAMDLITTALVRLAAGELDPLAGRFLHVGADDLDLLLANATALAGGEARTLRLSAYGPDDPLASMITA